MKGNLTSTISEKMTSTLDETVLGLHFPVLHTCSFTKHVNIEKKICPVFNALPWSPYIQFLGLSFLGLGSPITYIDHTDPGGGGINVP